MKNKKRMTLTVNHDYTVSTKYSGNTEDMLRCYRALTRFVKTAAQDMTNSAMAVIPASVVDAEPIKPERRCAK